MIDHGALTDLVLGHLQTVSGELVGDGIAPADGGWVKGQPNQSVFVPYSVLASGGASPTVTDFRYTFDWRVSWSLRHFGGSRKQVDWIATKNRSAVEGLLQEHFGVSDEFKIIGMSWDSLGAVNRIDTTNPAFWQAFDSFSFICSRVHIV